MSAHSCNELCELSEEFHDIQKHEGPHEAWYASKQEMRALLNERLHETYKLLELLEK